MLILLPPEINLEIFKVSDSNVVKKSARDEYDMTFELLERI